MSVTSITNVAATLNSDHFKDYMSEYYSNSKPSPVLDVKPDSIVKIGDKVITGKQLDLYFKVLDKLISEQYPEELL